MATIRFESHGWNARFGSGYDESSVVRIVDALGHVWAERFEGMTVLVGYDTRRDSKRLADVAGQVLSARGLRAVVSDRVCSTPALGWSVAQDGSCIGGVMLTASRRPYTYGGIRVRQSDGGPISTLFAQRVEERIESDPTDDRGPVYYADFVTPYIENIEGETDTSLVTQAGLHVVLDTMYGTGCGVAADLLRRIGCRVTPLHDKPVSDFRGIHPHAAEPWIDECERVVVSEGADLGIVLNGDCSRGALIDGNGRLVSSHDVVPLALDHLVSQRGAHGRVVATAASSVRIERQAHRLDCDFTRVPVGFESVYREFADGDVILGTEELGGICVPCHLPERDALMSSAMLIEYMAGAGARVDEVVHESKHSIGAMEYLARDIRLDFGQTQRLRNLLPGLNPPTVLGETPYMVTHPSGLRVELEDGSWLLVRAATSGAGARVVAEAGDIARANELVKTATSLIDS